MKALLYVIAIAAIGAGGWFSYSTMNKFTDLKKARKSLEGDNKNLKASIERQKNEANDMEAQQKAANTKLEDTKAELDSVKGKITLKNRESADWKSKIAEQKEKLDEIQNLITEIKKVFKAEFGDNVDLAQIPGLVKRMEDDLKKANKKLEELEEYTGAADKRVAKNKAALQDLGKRLSERAARLRGNAAVGQVSSVNHDWGFAVVKVPSNMPVTDQSKLLVKRGSDFVGKLKINAIEGNRIIADVDYKSMTPGLVVRSGDQVVLEKPATN
ncbi:MAG: hypothetical protein ACPG32_09380 [Akkermansiaceae bacterium]